jgi:mannose/fructose/N-acetylgalactosamine-specific phosphotransferase system component IIC
MEKLCIIAQKITVYLSIVAYALLAIFAFGMSTPAAPLHQYQETINFYKAIQPYNDEILYFAIVGVILALFYRVLRNDVRKVYYVSNFIWSGIYAGFSIFAGIESALLIRFYQQSYAQVDFAKVNAYFAATTPGISVNPNTPVFLLGYLVSILVVLSAVPVLFVGIRKAVVQLKKKKDAQAPLEEAKHE